MKITNKKIVELIFNLIIVVLFAYPFLLILYTQFLGIDFQNLIAANPYWNVMFIQSFITPFIGFYVLQLKESLVNDRKIETVILQLLILAIGLFIMENETFSIFIFILISYLFYHWKIRIRDLQYYLKKMNFKFKDYLAPIAVLSIAVIIRIMFNLVSNA